MAKTPKTEDTQTPAPVDGDVDFGPRIECARVKFIRVYDGPGTQKKPNDMLTSRKLRKDSEFEISYLPKLRQFEVVHCPRGQEDLNQPWMVPESQVARWEVLADALSRGEHR